MPKTDERLLILLPPSWSISIRNGVPEAHHAGIVQPQLTLGGSRVQHARVRQHGAVHRLARTLIERDRLGSTNPAADRAERPPPTARPAARPPQPASRRLPPPHPPT